MYKYIVLFVVSCRALNTDVNLPACRYSPGFISDLELDYQPEAWSTRFPTPGEVLQHHINFVTAESEVVTKTIPHKLAIEYGSTPGQKLDIIGTDLPDDAPILVFLHGGFWQKLSREISRYPAGPLYRSMVKTIVVGYDLCPAVTLPEIVGQMQNAARYVFQYAERMKSRAVYFAGHSAGAQLITKLLANSYFLESTPGSGRLQGVFLISGLYDLREMVYTSVNGLVQLTSELAVAMSPQFDCFTHLQARRFRIYILAGENDSPTFKKQSWKFYKLLQHVYLIRNIDFEIKGNMDHFNIMECLTKDGNYLQDLLLHDICENLG